MTDADAEYEKVRAEAWRLVQSGQDIPPELLARRNACRDCERPIQEPLPMLKRDVWEKAVPDGSGYFHRVCFEKRLGRPLGREDLADPSDYDDEDFSEAKQ